MLSPGPEVVPNFQREHDIRVLTQQLPPQVRHEPRDDEHGRFKQERQGVPFRPQTDYRMNFIKFTSVWSRPDPNPLCAASPVVLVGEQPTWNEIE